MNVNGAARDVIPHHSWIGTDMRPGPGVDWVITAGNIPKDRRGQFDGVVCCETLEHCERWQTVARIAWSLAVRYTGIIVITVPSPGFPRHDYPSDYWRFTPEDLRRMAGTCSVLAEGAWVDSRNSPGCGIVFRNDGTPEFAFGVECVS